jgi:hypothetical protein
VAKLLVRHSAVVGARAAVVVIEESAAVPGAPENVYAGLGAGELELEELGDIATDTGALNEAAASSGGTLQDSLQSMLEVLDRTHSRVSQIRTAAYFPLLALSPDLIDDGLGLLFGPDALSTERRTVRGAIGDTGPSRLIGAFLYNLGAVAVTFPTAPGSEEWRTDPYAHEDEVTVRVTYMFKCNVPLASLLLCDSGLALFTGVTILDPAALWRLQRLPPPPENPGDLPDWAARVDAAADSIAYRHERVSNFGDHQDTLDQVESPLVQMLLLLRPGARYMLIESEATLPVQSARYYPRGDGSGTSGGGAS